MAKEKVVKAPRITQKLLMVLTTEELRSLCVFLEAFPSVQKTWLAKQKELAEAIILCLPKFAEKDFSEFDWDRHRPPTKQFCLDLQDYLLTGNKLPVYPGDFNAPNVAQVVYEELDTPKLVEPAIWETPEEELDEAAVLETLEAAEETQQAARAAKEKKMPVKKAVTVAPPVAPPVEQLAIEEVGKSRFVANRMGKAAGKKEEEPPTPTVPVAPAIDVADIQDGLEVLQTQFDALAEKLDMVQKQLADVSLLLDDQMQAGALVDRALLFIVNQGFVSDDATPLTTLAELPE